MARGDERDDGVAAVGGGGGVDAAGHVDVEAGLAGQVLALEDGVEGLAVLVREEDVVGLQLGALAVDGPVERDGAAGAGLAAQRLAVPRRVGVVVVVLLLLREQVAVRVYQVRVDDDDVRLEDFARALDLDAAHGGAVGSRHDLLHGRVEPVLDAEALAHAHERVEHGVEPAPRVPDALGQLGVLQQGVGGGGLEGGHAHVHGGEGEDAAEALGPEVLAGAAPDGVEGVDAEARGDEPEGEHVPEAGEVLVQNVAHAELVVVVGLAQPGQVAAEAVLALPALDLGFHAREVR